MPETLEKIKVPQLYKRGSKILKSVKEEGANIKDLVFGSNQHLNIKALYALVLSALKHEDEVNRLLEKSGILVKEKADPWLMRILVTELAYGKKSLSGESKPVQKVLSYFKDLADEIGTNGEAEPEQKTDKIPRYVRINTLKISVEDALKHFEADGWEKKRTKKTYSKFLTAINKLNEYQFMQDFHIKEILVFSSMSDLYKHELYLNGSIAFQDKASCLAACLLNPPPHSITLDMCAAPGMKTTLLASLMNNEGTLYAVEMNKDRYNLLCKHIDKYGVTCAELMHKDALEITDADCPGVEYILVDPSCSGSGIVNRPVLKGDEVVDATRLQNLAYFQVKILKHALTKFPNVKRVVYSTCSCHIEENEWVVQEALKTTLTRFQVVDTNIGDRWLHFGTEELEFGPRCLYAKSQVDLTNGFFVAVFEKVFREENFTIENEKEEINGVSAKSKQIKKKKHKKSKEIKEKKKRKERNEDIPE